MSGTIAGREARMNLIESVIGDAQRRENFLASRFAAPFFLDMTPGKEASQCEGNDEAGCEPLPQEHAAAMLLDVAAGARFENALPQTWRRGPAEESFVQLAFKLVMHGVRLLSRCDPA
jgi:hypothetical protein